MKESVYKSYEEPIFANVRESRTQNLAAHSFLL